MKLLACRIFLWLAFPGLVFSQVLEGGYKVDEFGKLSNDDLQARVWNFFDILQSKPDIRAFVVLHGDRFAEFIMERRIRGCATFTKHSPDLYTVVFGPPQGKDVLTQFYAVPKAEVGATQPEHDFTLPDLKTPAELTPGGGLDEFCPRNFDLEWFAPFMLGNPTFRGKAWIDTSAKTFRHRVAMYKSHLRKLGVNPERVTFLRRHFPHEQDERWWLIPKR